MNAQKFARVPCEDAVDGSEARMFWWIDALRTQRGIRGTALSLAIVLSSYANKNGEAYPQRPTLARALGVTVPRVDEALKHLLDAGIIRRARRRYRSSTVYVVQYLPPSSNLPSSDDLPLRVNDLPTSGSSNLPTPLDTNQPMNQPAYDKTNGFLKKNGSEGTKFPERERLMHLLVALNADKPYVQRDRFEKWAENDETKLAQFNDKIEYAISQASITKKIGWAVSQVFPDRSSRSRGTSRPRSSGFEPLAASLNRFSHYADVPRDYD